MFVRIKPFNPKRGQTLKSYAVRGMLILESRGWHEVPDDLAEILRNVHVDSDDHATPLAFDVCTREEANRIDEEDARIERERRLAGNAVRVHHAGRETDTPAPARAPLRRTPRDVMTTEDLHGAREPEPEPAPGHEFDDLEKAAGVVATDVPPPVATRRRTVTAPPVVAVASGKKPGRREARP